MKICLGQRTFEDLEGLIDLSHVHRRQLANEMLLRKLAWQPDKRTMNGLWPTLWHIPLECYILFMLLQGLVILALLWLV